MITATARLVKPDDVVVSITLTMTAGEWRQVAEMIPTKYPGWPVTEAISKAVNAFTQTHTAEVEAAR